MEYTLVKPNMDTIGFPSVLVYCDQKEVANLTPITKYLKCGGGNDSGDLRGRGSGSGNGNGNGNGRGEMRLEDVMDVLASFGVQ